eukprot:4385956-Prymnesium_polylepis.1
MMYLDDALGSTQTRQKTRSPVLDFFSHEGLSPTSTRHMAPAGSPHIVEHRDSLRALGVPST